MLKHKQILAFLPGLGFSAKIWECMLHKLPDYQHVMLDFAHTAFVAKTVTSALVAQADVINQQLPQHCVLVAWSFGGLVALALCQRYPSKYARLVLIASTPKFTSSTQWHGISPQQLDDFTTGAKHHFSKLMRQFCLMVNYPQQGNSIMTIRQYAAQPSQHSQFMQELSILMHSDLRDTYAAIKQPILHIHGDNDCILPLAASQQLARAHAHSAHAVIKLAGHAPFVSHGDECANLIHHFFTAT